MILKTCNLLATALSRGKIGDPGGLVEEEGLRDERSPPANCTVSA